MLFVLLLYSLSHVLLEDAVLILNAFIKMFTQKKSIPFFLIHMMSFSNEKVAEMEVLVQVRNKGISNVSTNKSCKVTDDSVSGTGDNDVTLFTGPCSQWSRMKCDMVASLFLREGNVCMSFPMVILS